MYIIFIRVVFQTPTIKMPSSLIETVKKTSKLYFPKFFLKNVYNMLSYILFREAISYPGKYKITKYGFAFKLKLCNEYILEHMLLPFLM